MSKQIRLFLFLASGFAFFWFLAPKIPETTEPQILAYRVDVRQQNLQLYWKDDTGQPLRSIQRLKTWLDGKGQTLLFATNGGMFRPDGSPLGLFIRAGNVQTPLDTATDSGNFYLKPNGVFYLTTAKQAVVCETKDFARARNVRYATQSGPLLVLNGRIHPAFVAGSSNRQIRNGVGILPDGRVLLAMSKQKINLYDFAAYFQQQGCRNALYLDGFVSRTYLPAAHWVQTDGDFGVLIGVTNSGR